MTGLEKFIDAMRKDGRSDYGTVMQLALSILSEEKATATAKCVSGHDGGCPWYIPGSNPPSRHAADEPLAVLADRKGYAVYSNKRIRKPVRDFPWHISLTFIKSTNERKSFYCDTYAEAESKAKAYLNGLEDRKGGSI